MNVADVERPERFQFTCSGGRHETLHELNRRQFVTNLLAWISGILE